MHLDPSLSWQQSDNQELINAVHQYWQGNSNLTDRQIIVLRSYLQKWIQCSTSEYPLKTQHLQEAKACKKLEDLKILTNRLLDWGIDPW